MRTTSRASGDNSPAVCLVWRSVSRHLLHCSSTSPRAMASSSCPACSLELDAAKETAKDGHCIGVVFAAANSINHTTKANCCCGWCAKTATVASSSSSE